MELKRYELKINLCDLLLTLGPTVDIARRHMQTLPCVKCLTHWPAWGKVLGFCDTPRLHQETRYSEKALGTCQPSQRTFISGSQTLYWRFSNNQVGTVLLPHGLKVY